MKVTVKSALGVVVLMTAAVASVAYARASGTKPSLQTYLPTAYAAVAGSRQMSAKGLPVSAVETPPLPSGDYLVTASTTTIPDGVHAYDTIDCWIGTKPKQKPDYKAEVGVLAYSLITPLAVADHVRVRSGQRLHLYCQGYGDPYSYLEFGDPGDRTPVSSITAVHVAPFATISEH